MQGMTKEWATQIRQLGNNMPAIDALYQKEFPLLERQDIQVSLNLAYGSNERQVLDLYLPSTSCDVNKLPVIIFLHGGGFIRGSKEHRKNIGYFFAEQGFAVILANYRLAPEVHWPSGAHDLALLWSWTINHSEKYSLNTQNIFLMGESAGATHVASLVLIQQHQPQDFNIAGAILLSGPYNPKLEHLASRQLGISLPDIRNSAYFGSDPEKWEKYSIIGLVDQSPFPLFISYTELDLPQMQVQASELFATLVCKHGYDPELRIIPDHNHFSQGYSFGLDDRSVSEPVLDFIRRNIQYS